MVSIRDAVAANAPDPEAAVRRLERVVTDVDGRASSDDHLAVLRICCQRAPYLATLLARDPARLDRVATDEYLRREKPLEAVVTELAARYRHGQTDEDEFLAALRNYRADELVRLGVREIELGNPSEAWRELANLADASFDAAITYYRQRLDERYGSAVDADGSKAGFVVIGMGKLGGRELNFSSDVDVIYAYSSDDGAAGELTPHEYFTRLSRKVSAALNDVTQDDLVFRVDLRLRPEGSKGAIANSVLSMERYYETWGRPWERQAWLKARPCAGDMDLGEEIMTMLGPFIYPRTTSTNVVREVASLNQRIKTELDSSGVDRGFDVKNGRGGIREIEFFVQALQLIHSGHIPTLRSRTTLTALDQLLFGGQVSQSEHTALAQAYQFLRHVEHMLQLDSGRQTQRLPIDEAAFETMARRLGHPGGDEFRDQLQTHTTEVALLFSTLGVEESVVPPEVLALLRANRDAEAEAELLATLGFGDPTRARADLERARRSPLSPFGSAATGASARVAPGLLAEIATSPDPNLALHFVADLIGRRGAWASMWTLFDGNPTLMRLIVSLFGTSVFLGKTFVNHPELIDILLQSGRARPRHHMDKLRRILDRRMNTVAVDDEEGRWDTLAEFKNAQVLRIGLADVAGVLQPEETAEELSNLAEVCLTVALEDVRTAMQARHGVPRDDGGEPVSLSILAMGKLGGKELGYASDLDVIFVYSQDGESDGDRPLATVTYMTRVAQRLINNLHAMHRGGRLYEIDTRLRPSGSRGLLVSSAAAWRSYHTGSARTWERQALTKLRPVAGDLELGELVAAAAEHYVYGSAPGEDQRDSVDQIAISVRDMRAEMERQLAAGPLKYDLKSGRGGLVDVEFASQFLQLAYGHEHKQLRVTSTVKALRAAAECGVADGSDCALLIDGYRFLRRLEQRMRIVHDRSVNSLPTDPDELTLLAHRVGYPDGEALTTEYVRWTQQLRWAYERVLGVVSPS